ncbi:DNA circularization N-terminal domain-containing protein [Oricola thermophila]|uniref:DNA circularization N-terminal domain-containing protein n=1 Tax=Oricola thermophila TaxID=2742145 RepID=A0A6N1VLY6_9HYPH|nr:DNA circularization N-terminal domain-containing protein [Oricola thermophila]QKV20239.1 DNA circularization N-terminal domain-containing protein [Oricola thermophila]
MRNWQASLRAASFRGVPFHVDSDSPNVGRRVVAHEISGGETVLTEDMGRATPTIWVSAYVVGDVSDAAGHALEAACSAAGAALLVLPMDPARMAHCTSCSRNRRRDRMGYVAYDLEFIVAADAVGFAASGLGLLRERFAVDLSAVASAIAARF